MAYHRCRRVNGAEGRDVFSWKNCMLSSQNLDLNREITPSSLRVLRRFHTFSSRWDYVTVTDANNQSWSRNLIYCTSALKRLDFLTIISEIFWRDIMISHQQLSQNLEILWNLNVRMVHFLNWDLTWMDKIPKARANSDMSQIITLTI